MWRMVVALGEVVLALALLLLLGAQLVLVL